MNKVYVVGLGPGGEEFMTAQARAAMERADVLCGYTVYVDLVKHLYPGKETYVTPMTRELERCRWALETAAAGRTVAMVCSGDAGVYGMAGPLLQLAGEYGGAEVEVVPGVTSALSGAAVLGAPLMHDFCVISLSDLLTPWEQIERRLALAAAGDFSICLYNPSSKKAGGLSAPRLRYPAAGKKPGHCLRLGAQHRPGGPAAPPADAGPAAGRAGGYVHHSVHRRGNDAGRGGPHGHAAGL